MQQRGLAELDQILLQLRKLFLKPVKNNPFSWPRKTKQNEAKRSKTKQNEAKRSKAQTLGRRLPRRGLSSRQAFRAPLKANVASRCAD
jgi:signal recognition particle subunit SEC65